MRTEGGGGAWEVLPHMRLQVKIMKSRPILNLLYTITTRADFCDFWGGRAAAASIAAAAAAEVDEGLKVIALSLCLSLSLSLTRACARCHCLYA